MPTFKRADESVNAMAKELLQEFESHMPLLKSAATIDFVFAFPDLDDETGEALNDALTKNGIKALGIALDGFDRLKKPNWTLFIISLILRNPKGLPCIGQ